MVRNVRSVRALKAFAKERRIVVYGRKEDILSDLVRSLVLRGEPIPAELADGNGTFLSTTGGERARIGSSGYGHYSRGDALGECRAGDRGYIYGEVHGTREEYGGRTMERLGRGGHGETRANDWGREEEDDAGRRPNFSLNEFARLCHCLNDPEVRSIFNRYVGGPECRGEVEMGMESPWPRIFELFNDENFVPAPPRMDPT